MNLKIEKNYKFKDKIFEHKNKMNLEQESIHYLRLGNQKEAKYQDQI